MDNRKAAGEDNPGDQMLTADSAGLIVGQGSNGIGGRLERHPLFNSKISKTIFESLDLKSLKAARLTCKTWMGEVGPMLQQRSRVTITWQWRRDPDTKSTAKTGRYSPTLLTFMKYVDSIPSETNFFQNYKLKDWWLYVQEDAGEVMARFWEKCGKYIRSLSLKNCYFGSGEKSCARDVFFRWTPNMESLKLKDVCFWNHPRDDSDDDDDDVPIKFSFEQVLVPNKNLVSFDLNREFEYSEFPLQMKEVFEGYPNLENLSVRPYFDEEMGADTSLELLKELTDVQREYPTKLSKLKKLDIFYDVEEMEAETFKNEHFELAAKLNLNLESLSLGPFNTAQVSSSLVQNFIGTSLSSSVKDLEIDVGETPLPIFPCPAALSNLRHPAAAAPWPYRHLTNLLIGLSNLATTNLDFLQNMPRLKILTLENSPSSSSQAQPQPQDGGEGTRRPQPRHQLILNTITLPPLPRLVSLNIRAHILSGETCIQKIGEWFPNLTRFEAWLDNELLLAMYKHFPNSIRGLKELIIHENEFGITDVGITGVDVLDVLVSIPDTKRAKYTTGGEQDTAAAGTSSTSTSYSLEALYNGFPRLSIGCLKELRSVAIHADSTEEINYKKQTPGIHLTYDSICWGFCEIQHLRYLKLPWTMIYKSGFEELCSLCVNLQTLDTPECYRGENIKSQVKHKGIVYTKVKM